MNATVTAQKTYCTDFLTKKMKKNEGEVPQYYVEGSHPAIIGAELFDQVQWELRRRKNIGNISSSSCFSGKLVCGDCGSIYGSKVWHSTSKYRRVIWQCNGKFKGEKKCGTPHLYEKDIQQAFLRFINRLLTDKHGVIDGLKEAVGVLTDNASMIEERDKLQEECEVLMELMRKMIQENARIAHDQQEYKDKYASLTERYDKANSRLTEVSDLIAARIAKQHELDRFIEALNTREGLMAEFDGALWLAVVHQVKVLAPGEYIFVLKDGSEFPVAVSTSLPILRMMGHP